MRLIRKLDLFVLKKFLLIFAGSFFIVLFVFIMQGTWKYVDDLIGKGLAVSVLGEFFWYMSLSLVPMSLPLAVLLAALISFGNMGEQLELLAMKASGVPLLRIMRPVMVLAIALTGVSFYFQNKTAPEATLKMRALLFGMRQTSPALEIPEGVFYNGITNYSLYVERKDVASGMLYNLMVYKTDQGFDKAQIVVADSGRMEMTADKLHLVLDIWNGEQFENLQENMSMLNTSNGVPYDRETFLYKRFIIDFDSNFEKLDEEQLRGMAQTKNLRQLVADIDSMGAEMDSIGQSYYAQTQEKFFAPPKLDKHTRSLIGKAAAAPAMRFDSIVARTGGNTLRTAQQLAQSSVTSLAGELEWRGMVIDDGDRFIRKHWIEWHQKFTLALACLFFFFVGAPLGAIIRKGGLGLPAVVSVVVFIVYYVINTGGMKMARQGTWDMVAGMWASTAVLAPLGVYLTYKANKDSVVFNFDTYRALVMRLLGWRSARTVTRKEVIIYDPDYARCAADALSLADDCRRYDDHMHLNRAPNYVRVFFRSHPDRAARDISDRLEALVGELSNSRNLKVLALLSALPVIYVNAHTSPFADRRLNVACGVLLPLGLLLWFRVWRFRLRLHLDLRHISATLTELAAEAAAQAAAEAVPAPSSRE